MTQSKSQPRKVLLKKDGGVDKRCSATKSGYLKIKKNGGIDRRVTGAKRIVRKVKK